MVTLFIKNCIKRLHTNLNKPIRLRTFQENVTILRIDGEENLLQTQMVEWVGDTLILIYVVDSASFDDAYDCKVY